MFSIFKPPPPGVWFRLPNTGSRVADAWTFEGDTIAVSADISESIQEEGVYLMVVRADGDEVPLGQYHIFVDDRAAFTRGETSPPLSKVESQPIEDLRRLALELQTIVTDSLGGSISGAASFSILVQCWWFLVLIRQDIGDDAHRRSQL